MVKKAGAAVQFRNRIQEFRRGVPSTEIRVNPNNFRMHPELQRVGLTAVLEEIGVAGALVVYDSEKYGGLTLIDGELRTEVYGVWDCLVLDVTDAEADTLLATHDAIGALAEINKAKMARLQAGLTVRNPAIDNFLAEYTKRIGVPLVRRLGAGGDEFDPTPEGVARSQPGQIWELGDHRLAVGDATDPALVAALFAGEEADLLLTDPPYGVEYVGKTADALVIQNDRLGLEGTRALVRDLLRAAPLKKGGPFYICSPAGDMELAFRLALVDVKFPLRQTIVWVKNHFVMGRQDYHWRHESILYGDNGANGAPDADSAEE